MPYAITWEAKGFHCRFHGDCTIEDVIKVFEAIGADACFDELRYGIFDYLDVRRQNVTEEQVELVAGLDFAQMLTNPRMVIASVSIDECIRLLWQHYASVVAGSGKRALFADLAAARDWVAAQTHEDQGIRKSPWCPFAQQAKPGRQAD